MWISVSLSDSDLISAREQGVGRVSWVEITERAGMLGGEAGKIKEIGRTKTHVHAHVTRSTDAHNVCASQLQN